MVNTNINNFNTEFNDNRLTITIVLSLLLHIGLFFNYNTFTKNKAIVPEPVKVNFLIAPPSPKAEEKKPLKNKPILLANKNTAALTPQIKRGVAPSTPPSVTKPPVKKKVQKKKPEQRKPEKTKAQAKPIPRRVKLKLNSFDINSLGSFQPEAKEFRKPVAKAQSSESSYKPFTKNYNVGVPDVLKTIRDGEITLLNAKASKYAVFVRRVALKVFSELRHTSWSGLSFSSAQKLRKFSMVEAKMSPKGELLSVRMIDSSGVDSFDSLLVQSSKTGAWDQNPPKGAQAKDGNIYFVFKAKTWAARQGNNGGERRWLLLSTGLL